MCRNKGGFGGVGCGHATVGKDPGPGLGHGHGIGIGRRLLRLDVLLDGCATVWMGPDGSAICLACRCICRLAASDQN